MPKRKALRKNAKCLSRLYMTSSCRKFLGSRIIKYLTATAAHMYDSSADTDNLVACIDNRRRKGLV